MAKSILDSHEYLGDAVYAWMSPDNVHLVLQAHTNTIYLNDDVLTALLEYVHRHMGGLVRWPNQS